MTASVGWFGCLLLIYRGNQAIISWQIESGQTNIRSLWRKRLFMAAWLCLGVIGATGMFQMSASTSYEGFLAIQNPWSQAILVKHLLVLVFLAAMAYLYSVQETRLGRAAFKAAKDPEESEKLLAAEARSENRTILLLAAMFFLILVFTSLARAA
ncbi:MAG: hypothetical protein AB9891_18320 [Anaerolineaceae bacterium]